MLHFLFPKSPSFPPTPTPPKSVLMWLHLCGTIQGNIPPTDWCFSLFKYFKVIKHITIMCYEQDKILVKIYDSGCKYFHYQYLLLYSLFLWLVFLYIMLKPSHELKFLNTENGLHWNVNVLYLEEFLTFNYVGFCKYCF